MAGTPIGDRVAASGAGAWLRPDPRLVATVAAVLALAGAGAVGGHALGVGSGEDLEAARVSGEAAGRITGSAAAESERYLFGFQQGRRRAVRGTYPVSYRRAYQRAFEEAGFPAPPPREIPVSAQP